MCKKLNCKSSLSGGGGGRFAPGGSTTVVVGISVGVMGGVEAASEADGVVLMLSTLVLVR